ncbi:hypothetical protein [Paracoccus sp. S3-43]|uniref:hypothetical protein n=1 Tax=Paracoccus sp. S3-43 TaxID=3030011 RepID=UPI0023AF074F|nr:hypothetical protein [Paracoccus sp. S3-43]WEF25147.1 hypothetical protein PXD02_04170 [Paracoccus sp. S3-43]
MTVISVGPVRTAVMPFCAVKAAAGSGRSIARIVKRIASSFGTAIASRSFHRNLSIGA